MDKETIKFYLITETLPCDTEFWGIAENKKLKNISKIDLKKEDEYFVDVYSKAEKEYLVEIKLSEDLSKAKINYVQKDSIDTDCLPITERIMKSIK